jgi:uncharacterized membrane protein
MRNFFPISLVVLCVIIGVYPLVYLIADGPIGLLQTKSDALMRDGWWRLGFYTHMVAGGVALSVGWSQFIKQWRARYLKAHRAVGKIYVVMVCVSGLAAVCISPHTTTGWIAGLGFGTLGLVWIHVTLNAYRCIRKGDLQGHKFMMVYSYSACCAAVTLRLWLPLLYGLLKLDFNLAYPIVAWLCWVPNLMIAHVLNSRDLKRDSGVIADATGRN